MAHVADRLHLHVIDEDQVARERVESARLLEQAREAVRAVGRVEMKVRRMNALYHERLVGRRDRRG